MDLPSNAVCLIVDQRYFKDKPRIESLFSSRVKNLKFFVDGDGVVLTKELYGQLTLKPPEDWTLGQGVWQHFNALKAIIKLAKVRRWESFLFIEDDCALTDDFDQVVGEAEVPDDWDILYYGANHSNAVTVDLGKNVMRVDGSLTTHLVAFRHTVYDSILNLPPNNVIDNLIARFIHHRFNTYALWPNVAYQQPGYSYLWHQKVDYRNAFINQGVNR